MIEARREGKKRRKGEHFCSGYRCSSNVTSIYTGDGNLLFLSDPTPSTERERKKGKAQIYEAYSSLHRNANRQRQKGACLAASVSNPIWMAR
jgi:hypothetical protein